uniref:Uncharacterized protein n=1 Tax=Rhizochromulina marina TaxID=1034831 RepID=A0A7S2SN28_9STRA|mmetsp:Transcript_32875/g.95108  ORF Transcript_32875/g.95108 Transcript_32875/m.95108 type:complete len:352 (+) Transcript_32875:96-1151(+)
MWGLPSGSASTTTGSTGDNAAMPLRRLLLYAALGATLSTAYMPLLLGEEVTHPCRNAFHGWKQNCVRRRTAGFEGAMDWAALGLLYAGFLIHGACVGVEHSTGAPLGTKRFTGALRQGLLGGSISFPYVAVNGAFVGAVGSIWVGLASVVVVLGLAFLPWVAGLSIGRRLGRTRWIMAYCAQPLPPLAETGAIVGFVTVSCILFRGIAVPSAHEEAQPLEAPGIPVAQILPFSLERELAFAVMSSMLGVLLNWALLPTPFLANAASCWCSAVALFSMSPSRSDTTLVAFITAFTGSLSDPAGMIVTSHGHDPIWCWANVKSTLIHITLALFSCLIFFRLLLVSPSVEKPEE